MSTELIGGIGIIIIMLALVTRFWLGGAFMAVGLIGYGIIEGFDKALILLPMQTYATLTQYNITVLPMFILMAAITANSGISSDLYRSSRAWLGHIRGGLAMATVAGCGLFAAISGSSMATAIAIGKAAYPELKKYGYDDRLSSGSIVAGGTIGMLIPPSMGFILYGILTETSIGQLFVAGIGAGLLEVVVYMIAIYVVCTIKPDWGPRATKFSLKERVEALKGTWPMVTLFAIVMSGIYLGIFTPTEAGAIGVFGALVITMLMRRLTLKSYIEAAKETAQNTGMLMFTIIGVMVFMRFLNISRLPVYLTEIISNLNLPSGMIIAVIIVFYIFAGAFLDILSTIFVTVPIFFPIVIGLGYDPLWFGVIVVMMFEIGGITPPMGLNVFVLSGTIKVPSVTIFKGLVPFLIADAVRVALIVFIPAIVLYLPSLM